MVSAAIASALTTAGASAATAATVGTVISTGLTVASALSTVVGGIEAKNLGKLQAAQTNLEVEAERTQAAAEEVERQRNLRRVLASQRAIFGASADDGGTPFTLASQSISETKRQSNAARLQSSVNVSQGRLQAKEQKSAGRTAFRTSLIKAGGTLSTLGSKS